MPKRFNNKFEKKKIKKKLKIKNEKNFSKKNLGTQR
jgi:hypothetical protein